ncbi:dihydroxyacetone kinase subunit DhaL [Sulfobacillus thermosulfidooxidans]|uniref:dihydroxyacetone kinase subunit DhaL n=1 Tax=Sulfobacillus thermosulfidooxidans TaxID=28034 RepID=UPI0002D360D7|nr:dihydroxyacetone kinase subunit DhaL [Sulfobacillus thermosulfidooxidans]
MTSDQFRQLWMCFADQVSAYTDTLNDLDRAIGDGDHGTNLVRGLNKVRTLWPSGELSVPHLQEMSKQVGMTLLSTVGGASGALWGSGLLKAAGELPSQEDVIDDDGVISWIEALVSNIETRGKAQIGDKTMVDVMRPAVNWLKDAPGPFRERLEALPRLTTQWMESTTDLQAKRGRAAYLGARSIGHIDPGSFSAALWWQCLSKVVASEK